MSTDIKIHFEFSNAAQQSFNQKRYGLKSCKVVKDVYFLADLLFLYKRSLELNDCTSVYSDCCNCSLTKIEETINTL